MYSLLIFQDFGFSNEWMMIHKHSFLSYPIPMGYRLLDLFRKVLTWKRASAHTTEALLAYWWWVSETVSRIWPTLFDTIRQMGYIEDFLVRSAHVYCPPSTWPCCILTVISTFSVLVLPLPLHISSVSVIKCSPQIAPFSKNSSGHRLKKATLSAIQDQECQLTGTRLHISSSPTVWWRPPLWACPVWSEIASRRWKPFSSESRPMIRRPSSCARSVSYSIFGANGSAPVLLEYGDYGTGCSSWTGMIVDLLMRHGIWRRPFVAIYEEEWCVAWTHWKWLSHYCLECSAHLCSND